MGAIETVMDIAIIEDDNDQQILYTAILERCGIPKDQMECFDDPQSFYEYRDRLLISSQKQVPVLIITNLNLGIDSSQGFEVLRGIRDNSIFDHTRVMIVTATTEWDIPEEYRELADAIVTKPIDVTEFGKAACLLMEGNQHE